MARSGWIGLVFTLALVAAGEVSAQLPPQPHANYNAAPLNWYTNAGKHGSHSCKKCGCVGCYARPYETASCLYGYQDHLYGRGPLINLGGATLEPGFRGYGVLGSPGYGLGLRPSSYIDVQANARGWKLKP